MPYKYVKIPETKEPQLVETKPKITETKEVEIPKTQTEEESQLKTVQEHQDKFFDEDDEIIEVNFD